MVQATTDQARPLQKHDGLFIGLMSGTSADAIDAALVQIDDNGIRLVQGITHPLSSALQATVFELSTTPSCRLQTLYELEEQLTTEFIHAANTVMSKAGIGNKEVVAIGSHGQTIYHTPDSAHATSIQLGNNSRIAVTLGIDTIGDFRRADIALNGQGAPLMPAFHYATLKHLQPCVVLNLGGIANVTYLTGEEIRGFDTGPANCLMDAWTRKHLLKAFDHSGEWARTGEVDQGLLERCLADPYFSLSAPKSTGTDYFNLQWLEKKLVESLPPENIQATLLELTAVSVANTVGQWKHTPLVICGGGAHNLYLKQRMQALLPLNDITTSEAHGVSVDYFEAMGFAWLAYRYLNGAAGNLPSVTGATASTVLGGCYKACPGVH